MKMMSIERDKDKKIAEMSESRFTPFFLFPDDRIRRIEMIQVGKKDNWFQSGTQTAVLNFHHMITTSGEKRR